MLATIHGWMEPREATPDRPFEIRSATDDDLPTLLAFEQAIVAAERPYDETLREGVIHYYDLAALVQMPEAHVVVAVLDGRIVGSGWARIRDAVPYVKHARYAFLGFMYVVPDARGQGVNAAVVEALAEWARAQGVNELVLEVYAENEAALRAYRKAGFQPRLLEMRRSL
jgi:GNAT superfamily N-acetyltransferase